MMIIINDSDVYKALTDRDTFDKLLQQGLKEEYLLSKDELIEFFMSIKDKVRIEELDAYELASKSLSLRLKQKEISHNANANQLQQLWHTIFTL